ncbi:uncharacterized protein LOC128387894 [Panonychus citri]|uniref:uncharacterized protein LOC128387894 n=1 Tax=Panonychus citri TaxID=50023 RepID=UPI002307E5C7|nr:uncharacterized protein LOC128387894 [Panonychus citri]
MNLNVFQIIMIAVALIAVASAFGLYTTPGTSSRQVRLAHSSREFPTGDDGKSPKGRKPGHKFSLGYNDEPDDKYPKGRKPGDKDPTGDNDSPDDTISILNSALGLD